MRIYTCAPDWEAMLTTIYIAWSSGLGHANLKLLLEPVEQLTLFDEYIHVDADETKALKLIDAINAKISPGFYHEMTLTAMAYEEDVLDNIFHMLILGFAYGPNILDQLQYSDVTRNREIRTRVVREACRFRECIRFHQIGETYVAHIEPKSRVAEFLGNVFQDRMPSECFIIIDDVHGDAVYHVPNTPFVMRRLIREEIDALLATEEENDGFTDLWQVFFETIAIKERINPKCQLNHSPLWARKHIVEFSR